MNTRKQAFMHVQAYELVCVYVCVWRVCKFKGQI